MKRPGRRSGGGDSGIALLVVLLTITLLTIVVIELTDKAQVETHLALGARNALQATYLARSGVNVGEALVSVDAMITPGRDALDDFWARPYPPLPIGDGTATFRVYDETRFLNINDLVGANPEERFGRFRRLFTVLGIDLRVLAAIRDWLDGDHEPYPSPPGAEQPYYLGLRPPVIVRNGPVATLRELLMVKDVTPTVFARLEGFVTALPAGSTKVNLNTAPPEVLYTLSQDLLADRGVVERLIASRGIEPFSTVSEACANVTGLELAIPRCKQGDLITTNGSYFRIVGVGEVGQVRRGITEVVKREGKRVTRVTWTPSNANLALTSLPPSDFLATLPVFGDR
ncbi:MAG: type II secretion system minor pseudopilin GspK [Deltaproteobacteria bacterium]|nr:type II secretion system minor pseudopilin GspK [Deltaproteobacteria bacterium]